MSVLKFSKYNMKINALARHLGMKKTEVVAFDLPAGWTCPAAKLCKSTVNRENGKRSDFGQFVCYATKAESVYPNVRLVRWHNFDTLKNAGSVEKMAEVILASIPKSVKIIRIHSSGDFFSKTYFQAWMKVAEIRTDILFFGYTKLLPYVTAQKPENFKLTYSYGGKMDSKYDTLKNVPCCKVVMDNTNPDNIDIVCNGKNLEHEDYYKIIQNESFGILVH